MALTKLITKKSALKNVNGIYSIAVNLVLTDNSVEVINRNFSQDHNPANNISVARDELVMKIQTVIDTYKANKIVYDSTAFTNAVAYINENITI